MEKDEISELMGNMSDATFGDEELFDVIPDEFDTSMDYSENPEKIGGIQWHGGKPVLSFSSLCDKTKSIFTQVKGIPIVVRENDGENYIYKSNGEYVINISKKPIKGLTKYTAFNHELGHYAFDSFNNQFSDYIDEELKNIPPEHHDKAIELYRSVFNVVEDQRIESLMGDIYLGTGKRFRQARRRLGALKGDKWKSVNPLDALHCAREYREDAIPKEFDHANKILSDIEYKDGEASILLSKDYINKVLNPWIINELKNCRNPFKEGKTPTEWKIDPNSPITCSSKLEGAFQEAFQSNRQSDHRELDSSITDEDMKRMNEALKKSLEDALKDSESNAMKKIEAIKDKIEEEARKSKQSFMPNSKYIVQCDRTNPSNRPRPNVRVAQSINKILKLLQARNKPRIKDVGDELSIPAVINRKAKGYGDVYIKRVPRQKLAILVSIDASGSMGGHPINTARDMMATLYKSIDGVDGIQLKAVIWGGGSTDVGVSEVDNLRECNRIHTNSQYGGTPTPMAVEYSERILEQMKAKKKLMIVITDGYPNSAYDSNLNAEQMVRREINRARKKGIGTMGLWVGGTTGDNCMDTMFGKDGYVGVDTMDEASHAVIKKFRKVVLSQMKAK